MKKKLLLWKQNLGLLLFSLLLTLPLSISAQISHAVGVTNGTFTPDILTITVGDTVVWTNTQGNHNVNGTIATFPSNPESFGNEVGPPGWVFTHVFTKAGVYDYHCDPHAEFGMVGKVLVLERTSYAVTVSNGTFTPDSLNIYVGDTVVWTNVEGNHNVNATKETFPNNPESFGNEVAAPGWIFTHVFTKAGVYDYQCDPHVQWGMVGKVIVKERTSHPVTVSNGTFAPDSLSIFVGDTVVWTNTEGNHNVNGMTGTYPSNPESFGNEVGPPGWVFTHVFTLPGVYDYQCDPHVQWGMVGKVIVKERTLHHVTVSNGTYTPDSLSIHVGDTVIWTNVQGNHNVNATTETFPNNPESFGNEVAAPGWVFTHVFTIAGVYDYQCDPHVQWGMVGKVIVKDMATSSPEHKNDISEFQIYPNPVIDQFVVSSEKNIESILIYDLTGAKVLQFTNINGTEHEISLDGIRSGIYLVDVQFDDKTSEASRLVKR